MPAPGPTIIRADRRFRMRALAVYGIAILITAAVLWWGFPAAEIYLKRLPPEQALMVLKAAAVVAFLSVVPLGVYLGSLGLRITRSRQFPPPGTRVIRDTALVTGAPALFRGRLLLLLALLLIVLGLAGAIYAHLALSGLAAQR